MPKAVSVFVALFLCVAMFDFAAAACLAAQPDGAAAGVTTKPAEKEMIHLNFPANLEAKVLIEYVSRRLGINILYDESVARKHITISSPAKIPKDSLLGLFGSALKMSGLMFIDDEQPGWKRIVPDKDLLAVAGDIQKGLDRLESARGTTAITQVFALKHVRADAAQQTVRPFLSKPGGNSFVISEKNLIVASDYAGNLRRISTVIELLDVPGPTASVRLVPVRHLDAESLAKQVTALLREKDQVAAVSGKAVGRRLTLTAEPRTNRIVIVSADGAEAEAVDLIRSLDVPTDAVRRSYRFRHISPERIDKLAKDIVGPERLKDRYKSVIDAESGLLIVTAPPRIHEHVESLVRELDVAEAEAELGHVRFYKLTNTTASNVLATIRAMESGEKGLSGIVPQQPESPRMKSLQEDFTGPNRPPPPAGQEAPKPPAYRPTSTAPADESGGDKAAPSVVTARTADAIVTVDTNTNTLIVIAPPSVQRVYKQLISMLDKRRPQVMVEVTLVTLDTSDSFSLGVDIS
ncbi:MAG: secretin N-terminal domain-containing protein, partial [Planctomycetota bacterium]|nr:secretin N-terminal domain-containing protein [Planctomycetota bacterium]